MTDKAFEQSTIGDWKLERSFIILPGQKEDETQITISNKEGYSHKFAVPIRYASHLFRGKHTIYVHARHIMGQGSMAIIKVLPDQHW